MEKNHAADVEKLMAPRPQRAFCKLLRLLGQLLMKVPG